MTDDNPTSEASAASRVDTEADTAASRADTGNREAANYRRRLRATEAERDQLRERLDATHRAQIERDAAERFADPRDVWAVTEIDQMRGDDGLIDPERVQAEFERIEQDRPHWRKATEPEPGAPNLHQGARASAERKPSFGAEIQNTLRGR